MLTPKRLHNLFDIIADASQAPQAVVEIDLNGVFPVFGRGEDKTVGRPRVVHNPDAEWSPDNPEKTSHRRAVAVREADAEIGLRGTHLLNYFLGQSAAEGEVAAKDGRFHPRHDYVVLAVLSHIEKKRLHLYAFFLEIFSRNSLALIKFRILHVKEHNGAADLRERYEAPLGGVSPLFQLPFERKFCDYIHIIP